MLDSLNVNCVGTITLAHFREEVGESNYLPILNPANNVYLLYGLISLLGGLTLPVYSICMAHMNDQLEPAQVVSASGTLVLILAAGMTLGPTFGGIAIQQFGPAGLFYLLSITASLTLMTAIFRLWNQPVNTENRSNAVPVSANLTPEAITLYIDFSTSSDNPPTSD